MTRSNLSAEAGVGIFALDVVLRLPVPSRQDGCGSHVVVRGRELGVRNLVSRPLQLCVQVQVVWLFVVVAFSAVVEHRPLVRLSCLAA